jgi:hypothetical protein
MVLEGFDTFAFSHEDTGREGYRRGNAAGIRITHEIPAVKRPAAELAPRIADREFAVYLPHLFGGPGRALSLPRPGVGRALACIDRELQLPAKRGSSPIAGSCPITDGALANLPPCSWFESRPKEHGA